MLLAQISDTHLLSTKDNDPIALQRADSLERCVNTINQMTVQPEAVVHTGDMVNFDCQNGYGLAREILRQLRAPFFPTTGNRDSRTDLVETFLAPEYLSKDAPFCQYRASLEGADLICVDTKSNTQRFGTTSAERLVQLEDLLQQASGKPVFIFLHHPPVEVTALKNPLQFDSAKHAKALVSLFDRYDNIVRILCGHTHRSDILQMGKHMASTLPSLATDIRIDDYPAHHIHEPIFQIHELHADNTITSLSHFALHHQREAA